MANNGKKIWTAIKIILAIAAIGFAAYKIYQRFFQKKIVAEVDEAEETAELASDTSDIAEEDAAADAEEALEVPAEAVIANAEAMEA